MSIRGLRGSVASNKLICSNVSPIYVRFVFLLLIFFNISKLFEEEQNMNAQLILLLKFKRISLVMTKGGDTIITCHVV